MKKIFILLLPVVLILTSVFFSCSSDEENDDLPPLAGEEDQLEGNWWSDDMDDGAYFDGNGGGYDLSYIAASTYCIDTEDPVYYRFDGDILTIYEDGDVTTGTWVFGGTTDTGTYTVEGIPLTVERVSVTGNCD